MGLGFQDSLRGSGWEPGGTFSVTTLEAGPFVGGRIRTIRKFGCLVDLGAEKIGPNQQLALKLCAELGVELIAGFYKFSPPRLVGFSDAESHRIWQEAFALFRRCEELGATLDEEAPWLSARADHWDSTSVAEWLRSQRCSKRGELAFAQYLAATFGRDPEEMSMLGVLLQLRSQYKLWARSEQYRFKHGAADLVRHLAACPGGPIHTGKSVTAVLADDCEVLVRCADGSEYTGEFCIVAVPTSVLNDIEFTPRFGKAPAFAPIVKSFFRIRGEGLPYGEDVMSLSGDSLLQLLRDSSVSADGSGRLVVGFAGGRRAVQIARLGADEGHRRLGDEIVDLVPELAGRVNAVDAICWREQPLARGGYFCPRLGEITGGWEQWWLRAERIAFAGDSISPQIGYIEGALRSADAAVKKCRRALL